MLFSKSGRVSAQIFFLLVVFVGSGAQRFTVSPDPGSTLNISNNREKSCKVCTGSGRSQQCNTFLELNDRTPVTVEFTCSRPADVFTVETVRDIVCSTSSCSGNIIQDGSSLQSLLSFHRRFTWKMNYLQKAFRLDFTKTGLRQISPSEACPDKHTFTLVAKGDVLIGKYCRPGSISRAQVLGQGSFSVDVPAGQQLQMDQTDVSVGEEIYTLTKISLTLPKGPSTAELLSPNYPNSFPDDDETEWDFQVPLHHRAAVEFQSFTEPRCWKKQTAVEYRRKVRAALVLSLTETQPDRFQGSFSMILRNCKMDPNGPGLSLNFTVSVSSLEVLCPVDSSSVNDFSLHINQVRLNSDCQMKMNSVMMRNMTVTSTSELFFKNCFPEDVEVTAKRIEECKDLKDCLKTKVDLLAPQLPTCLPAPLSSITWTLRPTQQGTVAVTSPSAFRQDLPEQKCNDSVIINIAEEDGLPIGDFCLEGAIEKVLIHSNVSVTLRFRTETEALRTHFNSLLEVSFEKEISERYVFMISLTNSTPVILATPGWPQGMKSYSTVSWIVSVPSKMKANLMFLHWSQPKCRNSHTNIIVRRVGRLEEDFSRTEIEPEGTEITISENFYLNVSNCIPESGHFHVLTKITLQKSFDLIIILGVVAALLIIFIIILVVVCIMVRKKKEKLNNEVSVYNPGNLPFQPGNKEPVYTSIDDTLVYSHLLKTGAEIGVYEDYDTYHSFTGNTDSQMPPASDDNGNDNMERPPRPPQLSSQMGRPLPNKPPSYIQPLEDEEI